MQRRCGAPGVIGDLTLRELVRVAMVGSPENAYISHNLLDYFLHLGTPAQPWQPSIPPAPPLATVERLRRATSDFTCCDEVLVRLMQLRYIQFLCQDGYTFPPPALASKGGAGATSVPSTGGADAAAAAPEPVTVVGTGGDRIPMATEMAVPAPATGGPAAAAAVPAENVLVSTAKEGAAKAAASGGWGRVRTRPASHD